MEKAADKLGVILEYFDDFTPTQLQQFRLLEDLYTEWNSKINVISRKDIDSIYLHHVLHSLSIAAVTEFPDGIDVIDIGCGGGFPGIPLAIFYPNVQFHLVDSIGKKLKVVEAVCEAASIKNITVQHTRVEAIKSKKFHYAISRAVAPLKELWTWANPLLRKGGLERDLPNGLICLKGGDLAQEIFESGTRPQMIPITRLFNHPYFEEKFLIHVSKA